VLVKEGETKLVDIQDQMDRQGMSDTLFDQHKLAQIDLVKAFDKEEAFWQERAKSKLHMEGDRNTTYFHRLTKIKFKTKPIIAIKVDDDIIVDLEKIASHFKIYFLLNFFCRLMA
jgi:hypothetical protein